MGIYEKLTAIVEKGAPNMPALTDEEIIAAIL